MKRFATVAVVVMLSISLVFVLAGCGGDTAQAKEYMEQGDRLVQQLQEEAQEWQTGVTTSMQDVSDPEKYAAAIDRAKSSANDLGDTAEEAKAEFQKIKGLEGVDDYKEYADLQIEALDKFQELIVRTNSFFDQVVAMVNAGDITGITTAQTAYQTEVNELGKDISDLDEEAQTLKADRDL